jgi:hypothetical protein
VPSLPPSSLEFEDIVQAYLEITIADINRLKAITSGGIVEKGEPESPMVELL